VPKNNILALPLGTGLPETIERTAYETELAEPIRRKFAEPEFAAKIRCLLTTHGVPIKVTGRGQSTGREQELKRLQEAVRLQKLEIERLEQSGRADLAGQRRNLNRKLARLQSDIDRIMGKETDASVDSELSMVLTGDYELYRWQPNALKGSLLTTGSSTLMVSRLDGPGARIARVLIDKAMAAEKTSLAGSACIDSRGLVDDNKPLSPAYFDKSLRDLALLTKFRSSLSIKQERTEELFAPGSCPRTVIYCGWYSLQKYIDAFDFVDGAIGYHIASLEAVDLRDANKPYLQSFPEPRAFFLELFNGRCLVEAYYYTKPFNSWRLVLIGDPLYKPFKTADRFLFAPIPGES
jgi:uncharacterized protein (TIGR03790 family)